MKKIILISICMMMPLFVSAQIQQGYVKTKGRLGLNGQVIAGKRLSGTTVYLKGRTAVLSQEDGTFSFPTSGGKNFVVQNVKKQGYVLTDSDMLSRPYVYSTNPLVFVLEDKAQQEADRRTIERKITSNLYARLQKHTEEIERLKEQNLITDSMYKDSLDRLNKEQEANVKIVKEMTERYAKMDFDQVDEFYRKVSVCIINGRLTEADSLLNSLGDINKRAEQYYKVKQDNERIRSELRTGELAEKNMCEELAKEFLARHELCKMRHEYDSAYIYLEKRYLLDTANVEFLKNIISANFFSHNFMIDVRQSYIDKQEHYVLKYLAYAKTPKGASLADTTHAVIMAQAEEKTAGFYNSYGIKQSRNFQFRFHGDLKQYEKSIFHLHEALKIRKKYNLGGEEFLLYQIAKIYTDNMQYEQAIATYKEALKIRKIYYFYLYMADSYCNMGKWEDAFQCYVESEKLLRKKAEDVSDLYVLQAFIARGYEIMGFPKKASELYLLALKNLERKMNALTGYSYKEIAQAFTYPQIVLLSQIQSLSERMHDYKATRESAESALEVTQKYKDLCPSDESNFLYVKACCLMTNVHIYSKDYSMVEQELSEEIKLGWKYVDRISRHYRFVYDVYRSFASKYLKDKQYLKAMNAINKAIDVDSISPEAYYDKETILRSMGKREKDVQYKKNVSEKIRYLFTMGSRSYSSIYYYDYTNILDNYLNMVLRQRRYGESDYRLGLNRDANYIHL